MFKKENRRIVSREGSIELRRILCEDYNERKRYIKNIEGALFNNKYVQIINLGNFSIKSIIPQTDLFYRDSSFVQVKEQCRGDGNFIVIGAIGDKNTKVTLEAILDTVMHPGVIIPLNPRESTHNLMVDEYVVGHGEVIDFREKILLEFKRGGYQKLDDGFATYTFSDGKNHIFVDEKPRYYDDKSNSFVFGHLGRNRENVYHILNKITKGFKVKRIISKNCMWIN